MSEGLLTFLELLLIPAGLLPVATAIVLRRYRKSESASLRERWRLALVLAGLGGLTSLLAFFALLDIRAGLLVLPFVAFLLLADVVSGIWLVDYIRGRFR